MDRTRSCRAWALGGLWLFVLGLAAGGAGQAKPEGRADKVVKAVTLEDVQSVLGMARNSISGVSDFSQGDRGEVIIAYRYYDADQANFEIDFANEIAPHIQTLYKLFKDLDRIRFQVVVPGPGVPLWKPFAEIQIDRKTVEDLRWTGFVARYILEQVLKNRK